MAEETEMKFKRIMDKLYHSPAPKSPLPSCGKGTSTPVKRLRWELGSEAEADRSVRRATREEGPSQCRPWDRGDLMRRLATFKAMTWFGKPKAIDPVNCARRGWINIEMDTLACEACRARLLFSNPNSWTLQQVEKAAAVFSLKLDNGHKLLCPWIDNICDEALAFFPPTPSPSLIESFKDRSILIRRLSALPIISPATIDFMRSPKLESFLSNHAALSYTLDDGMKLMDSSESSMHGVLERETSTLYHQAHKILSLCGWEPRLVPYVVDSVTDHDDQNRIIPSVSAISRERDDDDGCDHPSSRDHYDPSSVVLECKLCRSCAGLWAFKTVPRPLEIFNLIESPDDGSDGSTSHLSGPSQSLTLTIAGGPRPTKQSFKPRISLPIVARHLRAVMEVNADVTSHGDASDADVAVNAEEGCERTGANSDAYVAVNAAAVNKNDAKKFDPISQHRPFCPWVASRVNKNLPGWTLTLQALVKDEASPPAAPPPPPPSDEVNDPILSIRRLFSSPPPKKSTGSD